MIQTGKTQTTVLWNLFPRPGLLAREAEDGNYIEDGFDKEDFLCEVGPNESTTPSIEPQLRCGFSQITITKSGISTVAPTISLNTPVAFSRAGSTIVSGSKRFMIWVEFINSLFMMGIWL